MLQAFAWTSLLVCNASSRDNLLVRAQLFFLKFIWLNLEQILFKKWTTLLS